MTIESIRARVEAATPGPWTEDDQAPLDHEGCEVWPWGSKADMDFAYEARADVPLLLAVAEAAAAWLRIDPEDDETPEDEWDPRAVALRDALAALELES